MIDIMLMVIDDTYIRVEEIELDNNEENPEKTMFILSEMEKELKKIKKFKKYIQIKEGPPEENDSNETFFESNETYTTETYNETTYTTETINETTSESNSTDLGNFTDLN